MLGVIARLTIKPGTNTDFEAAMKAGDYLAGRLEVQLMQEVRGRR